MSIFKLNAEKLNKKSFFLNLSVFLLLSGTSTILAWYYRNYIIQEKTDIDNQSEASISSEEIESTTLPTLGPTETPTPTQTQIAVSGPSKVKPALLQCTNCWLAPVDKTTALPDNYVPTVSGSGLTGGGSITLETKANLSKLFQNAASRGITITLQSGYRSYYDQKATFESWVQKEMVAGYDRKTAETRANKYSAQPGHSEHQLGTTVDLKCSTCDPFTYSSGNIALYIYLKENAHKFGFIISYPDGKTELTGYKPEPWHIRYIGKNFAQELYDRGYLYSNEEYLAKFLEEKELY